MDIAIHWGVLRYLWQDIQAKRWIPVIAIVLDVMVLSGFVWVKLNSDPFVIGIAIITMILIAIGVYVFLHSTARKKAMEQNDEHQHSH